jgi:hypothetical protein
MPTADLYSQTSTSHEDVLECSINGPDDTSRNANDRLSWREGIRVSATARDVLGAFEKLSAADKHEVTVEILRRSAQDQDLPEQALAALADELFRGYDAEEAARADP